MASSAGFSIASSPPGAIGGIMSPQKSGRKATMRKAPTAAQLLEQIRHLETEGNKLRVEKTGNIHDMFPMFVCSKQDQTCIIDGFEISRAIDTSQVFSIRFVLHHGPSYANMRYLLNSTYC